MRLKQYYKMWNTLYESEDIEYELNELIDLKTNNEGRCNKSWKIILVGT